MLITTPRLLLREYAAADLQALVDYQSDPRTREFYGPNEARSDQMTGLLGTFIEWADEHPRRNFQLAITSVNSPRTLMGSCGLRQGGLDPGSAELGLEVAPNYWGHGYATEAARAVLKSGFRDLLLDAVHGTTVSENIRIAHVLRRLGFELLGTSPGPDWMRARNWTNAEWRLTREHWEAQ